MERAAHRLDLAGRICCTLPRQLHMHQAPSSYPRHSLLLSAFLLCFNFYFLFVLFFSSVSAPFRALPLLIIWLGAEAFSAWVLAVAFAHWKSLYLCWAGSSECQTCLPFSSKRIQGQFVENVVWPVWKAADCLGAVFRKQAAAQVTFATGAIGGGVVQRDVGW